MAICLPLSADQPPRRQPDLRTLGLLCRLPNAARQDAGNMRRFVTVLWLVVATIIVLFAENAAHFSPWEFIIPGTDPWTRLAPLALFGSPLLLLVSTVVSKPLASGMIWEALALLTLPLQGVTNPSPARWQLLFHLISRSTSADR